MSTPGSRAFVGIAWAFAVALILWAAIAGVVWRVLT